MRLELKIQYLEIVTENIDAACELHAMMHGVEFSEPDENLGGARTAEVEGGGLIGIRPPMRDSEQAIVRPYLLVEDIVRAVNVAEKSGATIAMPPTDIAGRGQFSILIHEGIESGLWQL